MIIESTGPPAIAVCASAGGSAVAEVAAGLESAGLRIRGQIIWGQHGELQHGCHPRHTSGRVELEQIQFLLGHVSVDYRTLPDASGSEAP